MTDALTEANREPDYTTDPVTGQCNNCGWISRCDCARIAYEATLVRAKEAEALLGFATEFTFLEDEITLVRTGVNRLWRIVVWDKGRRYGYLRREGPSREEERFGELREFDLQEAVWIALRLLRERVDRLARKEAATG